MPLLRPLLGLVAASALALSGCAGTSQASGPAGTGQGFVAGDGSTTRVPVSARSSPPQIAGELLDGAAYDVAADAPGKVVVLNFWGSWCGPCRKEAPALQATAQRYADRGVTFLGVNIKDQRAAAQAFERGQGVTYPSLYDPEGRVGLRLTDLPPVAIPTTIVLDRAGRPAGRILGATTASQLGALLDEILAEPA